MRVLIPFWGDEQHRISAADVDGSMQNTRLAVASDRHTTLFSNAAIATVERRCLSDDGLIEHQDNRPLSAREPPF